MTPSYRRLGIGAVLAVVLLCHWFTRVESIRQIELDQRQFWADTFRYSLSALAGQGLRPVRFAGVPQSIPLQKFLSLRSASLSREEFDAYFSLPESAPLTPPVGITDISDEHLPWPLYTTRILDLWTATGLWWLFGIRWDVLFLFYAGLSTVACFCFFLIGRGLSSNGWVGLVAAGAYSVMPIEISYTAYSPRDISPLWFAAPAWAALACLVGCQTGWIGSMLACLFAGFLAALGLGWRHDALVTVMSVAGLAGPALLFAGRGWAKALGGTVACLLAVLVTRFAIASLCPVIPQGSGVGFHMASYAEETRCNLFHIENSMGVSRDDLQVILRVAQRRMEEGLEPLSFDPQHCHEIYGPDHARISRELFFESFQLNLPVWLSHAPNFIWRSLQATRLADLPLASTGHAPELDPKRTRKPMSWWLAIQKWLAGAVPVLALVGALRVCFPLPWHDLRGAWLLRGLVGFLFGYMLILFFVLPEEKHAGPLLLPMAILTAEALAFLLGLGDPVRLGVLASEFTVRRITTMGLVVIGLVVVWQLVSIKAVEISTNARRLQVGKAYDLAEKADWETNSGDPVRQEWIREGELRKKAVAILAWVQADESGVRLACREGTFGHPKPLVQYHDSPSRLFTTWHRVPDGEPSLFVITLPGQALFGDERGDIVRLEILGNGKILRTALLELSNAPEGDKLSWLRTLVTMGENQPGSPRLRSYSMSGATMHRLKIRDLYLGLELEEQALYDAVKWRHNLHEEDRKQDNRENDDSP